jgi:hypothetical protein
MTKFVSRRGSLGIAIEATRFTPVSPTYWLPWAVMSFADGIEGQREEEGLGNIADSDAFYVTFKKGEGNIDSQLFDQALGYILTSLLGAAPVTSGGNPYTHTFTLSQSNQPKTLSLYWKDPDRSYMFAGATVDSLKITVAANAIVAYTVGFKSKGAKDWTAQTPVFTTLGLKFLQQHLQVRLASSIAGLSGASETAVKGLELTFDRNTMFDQNLGTVEVTDILAQSLSISGTLELNLTDDTYRTLMLANTYQSLEVYFFQTASSSLKLQFPRVDWSEWEPDYSLNDIAQQKVNFKANYDAANALDIISTCTLINTKVSY